jgi:hypothetical protein
MAKPQFVATLDTVNTDVIRVASHYPLITDFFFRVLNQPLVEQHYPWFLPQLLAQSPGTSWRTLGGLFDVKNDRRRASLSTFLSGVEAHPSTMPTCAHTCKNGRLERWRVVEDAWSHRVPTRAAMADEPDWHNLIQATVRECVRTWELQARTGPVKPRAREAIVSRAVVLLMQRLEGHPPHLVVALLPRLPPHDARDRRRRA